MKSAYRHPGKPVAPGTPVPPDQMQPVTSLRVKSVIAAPVDGSQALIGRSIAIRGVAWGGDAGPISAVDVSVDGGRSWRPAALREDQRTQFGWRQWEFHWTPSQEAYYTILARATDAAGNTARLGFWGLHAPHRRSRRAFRYRAARAAIQFPHSAARWLQEYLSRLP